MVSLIRVDDRLVHGQITTTWVPYLKADTILVASDEVASDRMRTEAIGCCAYKGLTIAVKNIAESIEAAASEKLASSAVIILVAGLEDAMRLYEGGLKFTSLNIGNIHDDSGDCRLITPSICIDVDDEKILERFEVLGVAIDLREVPTSTPGTFKLRGA
ncbi:MAG: PTS sugar transporter subunit IIB [Thermodesulfobacteriota bacterium]